MPWTSAVLEAESIDRLRGMNLVYMDPKEMMLEFENGCQIYFGCVFGART